jgi:hypothetical protein
MTTATGLWAGQALQRPQSRPSHAKQQQLHPRGTQSLLEQASDSWDNMHQGEKLFAGLLGGLGLDAFLRLLPMEDSPT